MKKVLLVLSLLVIFAVSAFAAKMPDYYVAYKSESVTEGVTFKNIMKINCQGGQKFRIAQESYMDGEQLADTIAILRLDKKLVWVLDLDAKKYIEQPLSQEITDSMGPVVGLVDWKALGTKIGQEKILGVSCDIYAMKDNPENKYWIGVDNNIMLKAEEVDEEGEKDVNTATELRLEKQADDLFELPKGMVKFQ